VDGEGWFTLAEERFKMAEILFQPQMGGVYDIFSVACLVCALNMAHLSELDVLPCSRAMGLHKAVSLCMDHCYNADVLGDHSWFKTVVLAGGSSCLPGLPGMPT
jgi:actin-related protein 8